MANARATIRRRPSPEEFANYSTDQKIIYATEPKNIVGKVGAAVGLTCLLGASVAFLPYVAVAAAGGAASALGFGAVTSTGAAVAGAASTVASWSLAASCLCIKGFAIGGMAYNAGQAATAANWAGRRLFGPGVWPITRLESACDAWTARRRAAQSVSGTKTRGGPEPTNG
jgi:hypothetical protein